MNSGHYFGIVIIGSRVFLTLWRKDLTNKLTSNELALKKKKKKKKKKLTNIKDLTK